MTKRHIVPLDILLDGHAPVSLGKNLIDHNTFDLSVIIIWPNRFLTFLGPSSFCYKKQKKINFFRM